MVAAQLGVMQRRFALIALMLIPQIAFAGEAERKKKAAAADYIQITTLTAP